MSDDRYFVYIVRSIGYPERLYIGLTKDIAERLQEHNAARSKYSKAYVPWEMETYISVKDKETAENLERYLKSGSGFAFLKKRLLPKE